MQAIKLSASSRSDKGKNAARRLRAAGQIPAVVYGKGKEARSLAISPDAVTELLYSPRGKNSLVELDVEGTGSQVMIAEYQYHPLTRQLLHADFVEVEAETVVRVSVPLKLKGKAKGIVMGGKLRQVFRDLPIRCYPSQVPVELEHDISDLGIDENVAASDIQVPDGVAIELRPKQTVATIAEDRRAKAKAGEEEDAGEEK